MANTTITQEDLDFYDKMTSAHPPTLPPGQQEPTISELRKIAPPRPELGRGGSSNLPDSPYYRKYLHTPVEDWVSDMVSGATVPLAQVYGATRGAALGGPKAALAAGAAAGYAAGAITGGVLKPAVKYGKRLVDYGQEKFAEGMHGLGSTMENSPIPGMSEGGKNIRNEAERWLKPYSPGPRESRIPSMEEVWETAKEGAYRQLPHSIRQFVLQNLTTPFMKSKANPASGVLQSIDDKVLEKVGQKLGLIPKLYNEMPAPELLSTLQKGEKPITIPHSAATLAGRENPTKAEAITAQAREGIQAVPASIGEPGTRVWGEKILSVPGISRKLRKNVTAQGTASRELIDLDNPKNIWQGYTNEKGQWVEIPGMKAKPDLYPNTKDTITMGSVAGEGTHVIDQAKLTADRISNEFREKLLRTAGTPIGISTPLTKSEIRHPAIELPFPTQLTAAQRGGLPGGAEMIPWKHIQDEAPLPHFKKAIQEYFQDVPERNVPVGITAMRDALNAIDSQIIDMAQGKAATLPLSLLYNIRTGLHNIRHDLPGFDSSEMMGLVKALDKDVDGIVKKINPTYAETYKQFRDWYDSHYAPFFSPTTYNVKGQEWKGRTMEMRNAEEGKQFLLKSPHDIEALDKLKEVWGNFSYTQPRSGNVANIEDWVGNVRTANVAERLKSIASSSVDESGLTSLAKGYNMWNSMEPEFKRKLFDFGTPAQTEKYLQHVDQVMSGISMFVRSGMENPHAWLSTATMNVAAGAGAAALLSFLNDDENMSRLPWAGAFGALATIGGMVVASRILANPKLVEAAARGYAMGPGSRAGNHILYNVAKQSGLVDYYKDWVKENIHNLDEWSKGLMVNPNEGMGIPPTQSQPQSQQKSLPQSPPQQQEQPSPKKQSNPALSNYIQSLVE